MKDEKEFIEACEKARQEIWEVLDKYELHLYADYGRKSCMILEPKKIGTADWEIQEL